MHFSLLKKRRLSAGMTQKEVAKAMGVSQPTYQRWEAGSASISVTRAKKLARILKTTPGTVLGEPQPFDALGIDESVDDVRTYFGEAAFHFGDHKPPLLLPISEAERIQLINSLAECPGFIRVQSLDNRIAFVRVAAIDDVYLSSEACGDFGPGNYDGFISYLPDEEFWEIAEYSDEPDCLDDAYNKELAQSVFHQLHFTENDLDTLITEGHIRPEDRQHVLERETKRQRTIWSRAREVVWQLTSGTLRRVAPDEDTSIYNTFSLLDLESEFLDGVIYLPAEDYDRTILIPKSSIDYISIPTHRYKKGALISMQSMLES